jgi:hypothetical protein
MALCRRVIVAESLGPSFRQQSRTPILCGLSFIHGKLWLENYSRVKNTPLAVLFSTSPEREPDLWIGIDESGALRPRSADA